MYRPYRQGNALRRFKISAVVKWHGVAQYQAFSKALAKAFPDVIATIRVSRNIHATRNAARSFVLFTSVATMPYSSPRHKAAWYRIFTETADTCCDNCQRSKRSRTREARFAVWHNNWKTAGVPAPTHLLRRMSLYWTLSIKFNKFTSVTKKQLWLPCAVTSLFRDV